jgi:hypothetical protein
MFLYPDHTHARPRRLCSSRKEGHPPLASSSAMSVSCSAARLCIALKRFVDLLPPLEEAAFGGGAIGGEVA